MRRAQFFATIIASALLLTFIATGCKRSPEDLEVWRPSVASNGLEKLTEWIADPGEPMGVRVRAAEILIEEDYAYVVGQALEKTSPEDRKALVNAVAPKVIAWYETKDASVDTYEKGTSKQVLGKEGAFHLYRHAEGTEHEKALEDALVDWLGADFFVRDQMGSVKLNQIAEAVGPRAADPLLKALEDPTNNQKFIADMLRKIDDPKVQEQVANTLVKMGESQLPKLDKDLEVAILEANHKAIVPVLVKIVDDENLDGNIRTAAHTKIGEVAGREALPIYLKWVKNGPDILRWQSIQAIGETQGKPGVNAIVKTLPDKGDYGAGDPEGFKTDAGRFCMVEVKEMKTDLESVFTDALKDGASTPAKALALRCLQEVGTQNARPAVEAVKESKEPIPAWGETNTLGALAEETLGKLK